MACSLPAHRGHHAKWCSQKCRRAASRGAIAIEVVDRVKYVEHELDQCLAEVLSSPLACRRAVYRWRQMLRDGQLHQNGGVTGRIFKFTGSVRQSPSVGCRN